MLLDFAHSELKKIKPTNTASYFVPKTIIPTIRNGDPEDSTNLTIWKSSFARTYEIVFAYLKPNEAIEFIKKMSVAKLEINMQKIRIFRLMCACGYTEDEVIFKLNSSKHSPITKLYDIAKKFEQKMYSRSKTYSRHHILPKSRGGTWDEYNIVHWNETFHVLFHSLFANLKLDEIFLFLTLINQPFAIRSQGVFVTDLDSFRKKLNQNSLDATKDDIIQLLNALNYAQERQELYNLNSNEIGIDLSNFLPRHILEAIRTSP